MTATKDRSFTRAIDKLDELVDPAILERTARYEQPAQPLSAELSRPLSRERPPLRLHVDDPRRWYAGYLAVRGEYERPYELRRDLEERVPQALLRDMLRPVYKFPLVERERIARSLPLEEARAALRESMAQLREPPPEVVSAGLLMEQERRGLRRLLREEPWQPQLADDAPRQYRQVLFGAGFHAEP